MGWLIALAVLVGLAILPLRASARFNDRGPLVQLLIGPFRMILFPKKKRAPDPKAEEKKQKKKEKKQQKKKDAPQKEKKEEEKGGSITDFLPLVRVGLDFLSEFRGKLRVNRLVLKLTMAGGDPCDLAVKYGKGQAMVNGLMPQLERFFVIKRQEVGIGFDFVADETLVVARLDLTITLGRLLRLAVRHGLRGLKAFMKIKNKRKGGVKT